METPQTVAFLTSSSAGFTPDFTGKTHIGAGVVEVGDSGYYRR
jgi:hypothetical protein